MRVDMPLHTFEGSPQLCDFVTFELPLKKAKRLWRVGDCL